MSRILSLPTPQSNGRVGHQGVPRRIALFTGNYNLMPDGVSLTLNRLVRYLEQQGAEILVFSPTIRTPGMEHAGALVPVPSVPMPGRPEYRISLGFPRAARARLAAFRPTLFHIATPDLLGDRALTFARRRGIPVVASYHTHFCSYLKYYGFEELEGFLWKYLRRFYGRCRHVYVPTPSIAAVLRAHEIMGGLRLWERGVDTRRFNPEWRSLEWRRSLGIADHEPLITFVGRPVWEKGLSIFAEVVRSLERAHIPHRSVMVGEGPAGRALSRSLTRTVFTGYLRGNALSRAYASSDIFLFPSDTETFGNVTLEAMASGLPTVCANATGSSSLVIHGVTGFLAEPGRAQSFLEYVHWLATDPALRRRMATGAHQRASYYEWEATLSRLVSYYDEILNPASASTSLSPLAVPKLA